MTGQNKSKTPEKPNSQNRADPHGWDFSNFMPWHRKIKEEGRAKTKKQEQYYGLANSIETIVKGLKKPKNLNPTNPKKLTEQIELGKPKFHILQYSRYFEIKNLAHGMQMYNVRLPKEFESAQGKQLKQSQEAWVNWLERQQNNKSPKHRQDKRLMSLELLSNILSEFNKYYTYAQLNNAKQECTTCKDLQNMLRLDFHMHNKFVMGTKIEYFKIFHDTIYHNIGSRPNLVRTRSADIAGNTKEIKKITDQDVISALTGTPDIPTIYNAWTNMLGVPPKLATPNPGYEGIKSVHVMISNAYSIINCKTSKLKGKTKILTLENVT